MFQAGLAFAGFATAEAIRPRKYLSETRGAISFGNDLPHAMPGWRGLSNVYQVLPNPELTAALAKIYTESVERTYINPNGDIVMLSVAYGKDQGNELNAAHRPEYCYRAQGFQLTRAVPIRLDLGRFTLPAISLRATKPGRSEIITYWLTIGDEVVTGMGDRKKNQIRYGLAGFIPDGVIFRMSTLGSNIDDETALHQGFARALLGTVSERLAPVIFGRKYSNAKMGLHKSPHTLLGTDVKP